MNMKYYTLFCITMLTLLSCVKDSNSAESKDSNSLEGNDPPVVPAENSAEQTFSYPTADVLVAELACSCYSEVARYSVDMQNWAADNYKDIMAAEEEAINESVIMLRAKEEEYFLKLQEARNCYEDSLRAFGEFYVRGAPAFPTLMLEYCPEIYNILMLNGGMARQALYGQEVMGDIPQESSESQ